MANDEERRFRLRPRKPAARTERIALASAYKTIMHYARMTSRTSAIGWTGLRPHSPALPAMRRTCYLHEKFNQRSVASPWTLRRPRKRYA